MQCAEPPMENTYAAAVAEVAKMKHAFGSIHALGLMAFFGAYSGCPPNNSSFDYIIGGGGTSGCVLANRLSEDPDVSVLLIEAGSDYPLECTMGKTMLYTQNTGFTWNYTLANGCINGRQKNNFITTAGKVLGGTSSINFMVHSHGFDFDYDTWVNTTKEPAWSFCNIQRLIKKAERFNDKEIANSCDKQYHGFDGNVGLYKERSPVLDKYFKILSQAGNKIVSDLNNHNKLGYSGTVFFTDQMRQNCAYTYLYPAKNRTNLVVLKNTLVHKVLIDDCNKATGVECMDCNTKAKFTFHANREVILAAGAFNTPKILQLSGIGPCEILDEFKIPKKSIVPSGYNYQNHWMAPLVFAIQKTNASYCHEKRNSYLFPSESYDGYANPNKSESKPVYRGLTYYIAPFTPATIMLQHTAESFGYDSDVVEYWYNKVVGWEVCFTNLQVLHPKSRGLVRIQSLDPFVAPLIQAEHCSEEIDMKNAIDYVRHYLKSFLNTDFMKESGGFFVDPMKKRCGMYNYECDEYWMCYIRHLLMPMADQCGTAAMGSVVDGRLRVYGVKRLRVVDGSIMPTIVSGSATFPNILIAENGAEMIKQDWKHMSNKCQ